ncbi:MAG TPA: hypothetical protein VMW22_08090 [Candidatus Desulfaltia sp.]|nr:hypothetical protein [Candidatus Desulfaltia sp.]
MAKDVDEELVNWNTILDGIIDDSETLVGDLLSGVTYVGAAGVLVIALGIYVLFIGLRYGNVDDPLFILAMIVAPGSNFIVGLFNIHKYIELRSRYSRLFDLRKKLKK